MNGLELIDAERERQIKAEGYSLSHDAKYQKGELTLAAIAYERGAIEEIETGSVLKWAPDFWSWGPSWWKPAGGPIRMLMKAGALYLAAARRVLAFNGGDIGEKKANELVRDSFRCASKIDELQTRQFILHGHRPLPVPMALAVLELERKREAGPAAKTVFTTEDVRAILCEGCAAGLPDSYSPETGDYHHVNGQVVKCAAGDFRNKRLTWRGRR